MCLQVCEEKVNLISAVKLQGSIAAASVAAGQAHVEDSSEKSNVRTPLPDAAENSAATVPSPTGIRAVVQPSLNLFEATPNFVQGFK